MEHNAIIEFIKNARKGTWVRLVKEKYLDKEKTIRKETSMVIRLGVAYTHIKAVGKETAEPLPWGHWVKGLENLVIEHNGAYYLRVANSYTKNAKSTYFIGGVESTKDKVIEIVGESKTKSSESAVYNIKFENIIALGE